MERLQDDRRLPVQVEGAEQLHRPRSPLRGARTQFAVEVPEKGPGDIGHGGPVLSRQQPCIAEEELDEASLLAGSHGGDEFVYRRWVGQHVQQQRLPLGMQGGGAPRTALVPHPQPSDHGYQHDGESQQRGGGDADGHQDEIGGYGPGQAGTSRLRRRASRAVVIPVPAAGGPAP